MDVFPIIMLSMLCVFYFVYFAKVICQKKQGITTDQMGKGNKPARTLRTEQLLRLATYGIVPVEVFSIVAGTRNAFLPFAIFGIGLTVIGVLLFLVSVLTMRNSWRVGIPQKQETKIVRSGIYRVSRNPAFLGFDLIYLGVLIVYPNVIHILACAFAITLLHLQILEEEKYLASTFGDEYIQYQKRTPRYFFFF